MEAGDALLGGEDEFPTQEISQEEEDQLLGEEGYEEYTEDVQIKTEIKTEVDENTPEDNKDIKIKPEPDSAKSDSSKTENTSQKYNNHYARGAFRGRMMRPPFPMRFPFGPRPPPGVRLPPPFMMRPGMRLPPGFRGRLPPPGMRMRFPGGRPPFPPGHPMFRPFPPGHPMFRPFPPRPGMRPPFPPFGPPGMMMDFEEDWEEEEEESEDGAKKIQTVIAGSGDGNDNNRKRPAQGGYHDMHSAAKRGRGSAGGHMRGGVHVRGGPGHNTPQIRGGGHHRGNSGNVRGGPHIRGGGVRPSNGAPMMARTSNVRATINTNQHTVGHTQSYQVSSSTITLPKGGQCHSNLRTIQCTDAPPPAQPRIKIEAPQVHQPAVVNRGRVYHTPTPTLTSIPIQVPAGMNLPRSDKKVLVQNLPSSTNYDQIYQMAINYGPITSLDFKTNEKSAVIEFEKAHSADLFTRVNNRKMMDLAIINVTRLM